MFLLVIVEKMLVGYEVFWGMWGFSWDKLSFYLFNCGELMFLEVFGYGGFIGMVIWIDFIYDLFVIFFSSWLYFDGRGLINFFVGCIGIIVVVLFI